MVFIRDTYADPPTNFKLMLFIKPAILGCICFVFLIIAFKLLKGDKTVIATEAWSEKYGSLTLAIDVNWKEARFFFAYFLLRRLAFSLSLLFPNLQV